MDSNTVAVISALSALVTTILILVTLIEIIKQRKSAYRPDIIILASQFCVKWKKLKGIAVPTIWKVDESEKITKEDQLTIIPHFALRSYNIGLGAAKYVNVSWKYDIDATLKKIEVMNKPKDFEVTYDRKGKFLNVNSEFPGLNVGITVGWRRSYNYILPTDVDKQPTEIQLPIGYLMLCSMQLYLIIQNLYDENTKMPDSDLELPSLAMTIVYKDVGGSKHTKSFSVNPKVFMYSPFQEQVEGFEAASGRLEVEEQTHLFG